MDRWKLSELTQGGLSQRQIAERLGCSQATVRYWLTFYGLKTNYRSGRESRPEVLAGRQSDATEILTDCKHHGLVRFVLDVSGYYRCTKCRAESVVRRRRAVKAQLVGEMGGCCRICGYDRSLAALEFHHLDPARKSFSIAGGAALAVATLRDEVGKCVLLCSNCHAEVEAGITQLPINSAASWRDLGGAT